MSTTQNKELSYEKGLQNMEKAGCRVTGGMFSLKYGRCLSYYRREEGYSAQKENVVGE